MGKTERYETVIRLNTDQARQEILKLEKEYEDLRKKQSAYTSDSKQYKNLQKEMDRTRSKIDSMKNRLESVNDALRNMSDAKPKQLRETIKDINVLLNSGAVERGSVQWKELTSTLKEANTQLNNIRQETKASQPIFQGFFKFLNDSWGGLMILFQTVTGISQTARKTVEDFAQMEEEMADVRKYTGLADSAVRELNEDLKKMDTRTSREQLNRLAGSAGRLGKDAKKDILEFVEAGDMINIALGDDLGDGAIEKVGKLSMAFGEDKKKGLKGAMLSTGSAINELVQNSSAVGGYLVDFTARVAGFGKQLGLTQAQIMGYGTVMDENLLRDEMAATAFGNMLTKMQTDTEKFSHIAGMNVKAFNKLLNEDANAAILAVADNLKKADPQTMMKMLDDMGLDGSRAVAVLATLADKIDDVRKHQELANKAYQEGTSVIKEYEIKNETAQAKIDKCKKKFHEMAVELGERLAPVVQHTITGASAVVRILSALTGFVYNHGRAVVVLTGYITAMTIALNLTTIKLKALNAVQTITIALHKGWLSIIGTLQKAHVAWRIVIASLTANHVRLNSAMVDMKRLQMTNIWGALATVILTVSVALYGAFKAWKKTSQALRENLDEIKRLRTEQNLQAELNNKVAESTVAMKTKIQQLTKIIRTNAYSIDERRRAIKTLQGIVPEYHASINREGQLFERNSDSIKKYIEDLDAAALAEAMYQQKVEINKKKLELGYKKDRIEGSLKAVKAERESNPDKYKSQMVGGYGGSEFSGVRHETNADLIENQRQEKVHKQRLATVNSELKTEEIREKYIDKALSNNKKVRKLFNKKVINNTSPTTNPTATPPTDYTTDAERKKQEAERRKQEAEERKRLKEAADAAKAESDAKIAAKTHEYAMGKIAYREYIEDMAKLQLEGLKKRRDVYKKGTAEYEKLNRQIEELSFKGDQKVNQLKLEDLRRIMLQQQAEVEAMAAREEITEEDKAERLRTINEIFLADKVELYKKGSKERMDAEWELEQTEQRNKTERERRYQQQLDQIRTQYLGISNDKQLKIALEGLEKLHKQGLLKEEEYQRALIGIQAQYANAKTPKEQEKATANDMVTNAENRAKKYSQFSGYDNSSLPIVSTIQNYKALMENLDILYKDDKENHDAYLLAKQQATAQFCEQLASEMQAAYSSINSIVSAASSYAQACSDLEVARITKNYDKQIAAAGKNEKKREKLEQQKEKAIAKAKNEANQKAMKMEIAQAIASTALAAINAYASASETYWLLGPIAAAMATAAGAIQIAAIQKQHEAQAEGYYGGGFTGGKKYRKVAGVVHEDEFVANHQAVNNPNVLPMLQFLDRAQRNNTVGSLTADDISRQLGQGGGATVVAPVVNVNNDHEELRETLDRASDTIERLSQQIDDGIETYTVVEGPKGSRHQLDVYDSLIKNTKKP